ncbi:MAG: hypothetical protein IJC59_03570 [Lachnospiraceae bacterium]|nr:hypothetical protein [Lachnospiraceae bacterium]
MGKKWIAVLLPLLLLLSGCGGGDARPSEGKITGKANEKEDSTEVPEPAALKEGGAEAPELAALREEIAESGALLGVAYLGYAELPGWEDVCVYVEANGYADEFPFLTGVMEDHAVLHEGGEMYLVVPANEDVSLTVSDYFLGEDAYIPEQGEDLLTVTDGKPLLLRGNVSEIVPNLLIRAEKGSKSVIYNPCISGMDGSLLSEDGVYDFTPYELVMRDYPGYDPVPDPVFTLNTWYARHHDGDGNLLAMTLVLNPDGTAEYSYGHPHSDAFEQFSGTWTKESDGTGMGDMHLVLELTGGPVNDPGEQYGMSGNFTWELQGSAMVLCHEGGSPLLNGTEGEWYTFMSFDGCHMVNNWRSLSEYGDWYYELWLFENGECMFSIEDVDGNRMVSYEGWWYLTEENTLRLNLMRSSGEHPESPDLEYISGEYLVENWEPTGMTLAFVSGEILTLDMEESTKAGFFAYEKNQ